MSITTVTRRIEAPVEEVFRAISEVDAFSEAVPEIVKVEVLSECRSGVGTRFRETRRMKGRDAVTELEVTEYLPPKRIRLVAESHGTTWDSLYTVVPEGDGATLTLTMEARPHTLLARLVTPLIRGMVQGALESDMDHVVAWCEQRH